MEYVPEKAELDGDLDDELRKVFEKFSFKDAVGSEVRGPIHFIKLLLFVLVFLALIFWPSFHHLIYIGE